MKAVNEKKDWRIASEIELIYKTKIKASERPCITTSGAAYELALAIWNPDTIELFEQFKVFLLSQANKVLGVYEVSSGGTSGTFFDLKLLFAAALKANATAVIMIHNHPSGKVMPSAADKQLTKKVKEAGIILNINLLDHLIIAPDGYYSFADKNII